MSAMSAMSAMHAMHAGHARLLRKIVPVACPFLLPEACYQKRIVARTGK